MSIYNTSPFSTHYDSFNRNHEYPYWQDSLILIPVTHNPQKISDFILNTIRYAKSIGKLLKLEIQNCNPPSSNMFVRSCLNSGKTVICTTGLDETLPIGRIKSLCNLALGKKGGIVREGHSIYDLGCYNVAVICLDRLEECELLVPGLINEYNGEKDVDEERGDGRYLFGVDVILR
jgi:hypothetical protein